MKRTSTDLHSYEGNAPASYSGLRFVFCTMRFVLSRMSTVIAVLSPSMQMLGIYLKTKQIIFGLQARTHRLTCTSWSAHKSNFTLVNSIATTYSAVTDSSTNITVDGRLPERRDSEAQPVLRWDF
jgi:hypothetical protein